MLAAYLGVSQRDASRVDAANRFGTQGRFEEAEREARKAERDPAAARALLVRAYALRDQGRLIAAKRAFAASSRADPNNWTIHRDRAVVLVRLGERSAASRVMRRAIALNPRMRLPPPFQRTSAGR